MINNAAKPFDDVRVRKAVDLVIDRKKFVQARGGGNDSLMMTTVSKKGTPYYNPTVKPPKTDIAGAQKLIDQVVAGQGGRPSPTGLLGERCRIALGSQQCLHQRCGVVRIEVARRLAADLG